MTLPGALLSRITFALRDNIYQQETPTSTAGFLLRTFWCSFTAWLTVSDRLCCRTVAMEWTGCHRYMRPTDLRPNHRVSQTWSGMTAAVSESVLSCLPTQHFLASLADSTVWCYSVHFDWSVQTLLCDDAHAHIWSRQAVNYLDPFYFIHLNLTHVECTVCHCTQNNIDHVI